ncbi:flagellar type III secretion system pore protein FliP [Jannaschia sp. R86511]|uniref:flagellar type III secretion system pore protein FliP n=1 Tax=Jannaschia sp. R86511 TaxID=3093853 RepID=UPI0036D3A16F
MSAGPGSLRAPKPSPSPAPLLHRVLVASGVLALLVALLVGTAAGAQAATGPDAPTPPSAPTQPVDPAETAPGGSVSLDVNGPNGTPASAIVLILAITGLSVAPGMLLMTTAFTKIAVVLALTRNAIGLQMTPPNQVLIGLSLFLTLFVMTPTFTEVNDIAVQPYLAGDATVTDAFTTGLQPVREFMLANTRPEELALITRAAELDLPANAAAVPITTLVPAFVLSELRSAFIIGFVIFVPFLVIDLVVSSALMSVGMMMLPPVIISLPFKILLFVLVDGWGMIVRALVGSYG